MQHLGKIDNVQSQATDFSFPCFLSLTFSLRQILAENRLDNNHNLGFLVRKHPSVGSVGILPLQNIHQNLNNTWKERKTLKKHNTAYLKNLFTGEMNQLFLLSLWWAPLNVKNGWSATFKKNISANFSIKKARSSPRACLWIIRLYDINNSYSPSHHTVPITCVSSMEVCGVMKSHSREIYWLIDFIAHVLSPPSEWSRGTHPRSLSESWLLPYIRLCILRL